MMIEISNWNYKDYYKVNLFIFNQVCFLKSSFDLIFVILI